MSKICMIAYSDYLSDARIRREAESLSQRGDQVDLICLPHLPGSTPTELNGVRLFPLNIKRYRGANNLEYVWSYFSFFLRAMLLVTWRHLRCRYDLIQVHTMPDFMVFTAVVPRLMGTAVLLDVHDLMPELYMSKFKLEPDHHLIRALALIERLSIRFAHRAIAVHRTHLEALVAHGSPSERFEILLNTPDPSVFIPRCSRPASSGFKLVYHGTISRRHGLELAVRAILLARREIPNLRFSIIGDGDDVERLMSLVKELGLSDSVQFTQGSVPVNDLPGLLADADAGVVPLSKDVFTEYMLPVKLMEYVALGIPVMVTRTRTIEQYFDDSMVEYISGESVDELTGCLVRLSKDPQRRAEMVARASSFANEYSWGKQKLVYYQLVDSLVHRKHC